MTSKPPKSSDSVEKNPPNTIAVALEEQEDSAPIVLASGSGFIAEKILELAFANDVRVREDSDLVQILAAVDVDSPIPTEAFAAVTEVLTYLYRANGDIPPENLGSWHD